MKIHLLAEPSPNPVLASALATLGQQHDVRVFDAQSLPGEYGSTDELREERPDVVLLKSRSSWARQAARRAELEGSVVVNSPSATAAALDRAATAAILRHAAVPSPRTWYFPALKQLVAAGAWLPWPFVVKSRTSSREDLVRLVRSRDEVAALLREWGDEPVVVQEFAANDGFDVKVWVIGDDLSTARRRSALHSTDKSSDERLDPDLLPASWTRAARSAGTALGLDLYGVDLLVTGGRPVVVDVNPFPGFRGASSPADSLLRFVEQVFSSRLVTA
ncbi:MAG: RimK family alpha-L-glutamate ligase [Actinomycetes bacterium]